MRRLVLSFTLAAAAVLPAQAAAGGEARSFRDWQVVCDNTNNCAAFGHSEAGGWVRIARDAGPGGAVAVHFNVWSGDGETYVEIDGRPLAARVDSETGTAVADAPLAAARALARGSVVSGTAGDATVDISLSGATAALLWIDERQGRLDTSTAFVRTGRRAVSTVPAASPLPVVRAAPQVDQAGFGPAPPPLPAALKALPEVAVCREETAFSDYIQAQVIAARLDGDSVLWGVPCIAGAYNIGLRFWTLDGNDPPRPVRFPGADGAASEELINPQYDPATRLMSAFALGRGIGDCGMAQRWAWTGARFELVHEAEMPECFGVLSEFWPVVWRAEVR